MCEDEADLPLGPSCELESQSLLRDAHVERSSTVRGRVPRACATTVLGATLLCTVAWISHEKPRRADAAHTRTLSRARTFGGTFGAKKCAAPNIAAVSDATGVPREGAVEPAGPEMGVVLGLYTYGAPASTVPALKNPRLESGCFPGTRVMTSSVAPASSGALAGTERKYDPITFVGHTGDVESQFQHVWQDTLDVQIDHLGTPVKHTCSAEEANGPAWGNALPSLHRSATYEVGLDFEGVAEQLPTERLFSRFAHVVYSDDSAAVSTAVGALGWNTVGMAKVDTADGPRPSVYLYQHPDDLTCALVFKGKADDDAFFFEGGCSQKDFCGFADPQDLGWFGDFSPREGHALVHGGFRDDLLLIVRSEDYTSTVHPKLSSCKGVHLVGHSLGAAEAEYFAACASRHLEEGDYGYNEHRFIAWQAGVATKLDVLVLGAPRDVPADRPQACEHQTGGTCLLFGCSDGRGALVECVDRECVCQDNACSVAGYCVPKTSLFE